MSIVGAVVYYIIQPSWISFPMSNYISIRIYLVKIRNSYLESPIPEREIMKSIRVIENTVKNLKYLKSDIVGHLMYKMNHFTVK